MKNKLTHLDKHGNASMVDIGKKVVTDRTAIASSQVIMNYQTWQMIDAGEHKKGDVLAVAKLAGIMAAKKTHDLIPLCHSLPLSFVDIEFDPPDNLPEILQAHSQVALNIEAICKTKAQTGVEMEALTAASVSALTIYDMCKAVDRQMIITEIKLQHKSGGKSGAFSRRGNS